MKKFNLSDEIKLNSIFNEDGTLSNVDVLQIINLDLDQVIPDPDQPRKFFEDESLARLTASIKRHGIIQPILVKKTSENNYQIIAGERRWRASKLAGIAKIPAVEKNQANEEEHFIFSLVENIQREDLNPIEEAKAFDRLIKDFSLTHEKIGELVGRSRVMVSKLLRLLDLCSDVQQFIASGKLNTGHSVPLLTLEEGKQIEIAEKIIKDNLSVRETERLVQLIKHPNEASSEQVLFKVDPALEKSVNYWKQNFSQQLSSKVDVKYGKEGQGRVVIHFDAPDDMRWLMENLTLSQPNNH